MLGLRTVDVVAIVLILVLLVLVVFLLILGRELLLHRSRQDKETLMFPIFGKPYMMRVSTGVVVLILAVVTFLAGLVVLSDLVTKSGKEPELSPVSYFFSSALAQESQDSPLAGWAYLGPKGNRDEWVFSSLAGQTGQTGMDIRRASRDVPIRVDHYDDFTGTIVGNLLGHAEPEVRGEVTEGQCVRVEDSAVVGFLDMTWIQVEVVSCPADP